jgi:hypothetical protein
MTDRKTDALVFAEAIVTEAAHEASFADRVMSLPAGRGARQETTTQRDMRLRGTKRFNAYGCK